MTHVQGGYSYSGQRCTAVKVVLVEETVADQLVEKIVQGVEGLSVGRPEVHCRAEDAFWGAMCSMLA